MNTKPPSLGRIVLFRPDKTRIDKKVRPAMIIDVYADDHRKDEDRVQLQVFTPSGDIYLDAKWSEQGDEGTWFWPPRVADREETTDETDQFPDSDADPDDPLIHSV